VRDQVSHTYKTTGKIVVSYVSNILDNIFRQNCKPKLIQDNKGSG
jgi:hypothetical protein